MFLISFIVQRKLPKQYRSRYRSRNDNNDCTGNISIADISKSCKTISATTGDIGEPMRVPNIIFLPNICL